MAEDELIAVLLNNATPPVVYPELWPQPEFAAEDGLTLGASWSFAPGEVTNSGTNSDLDGLLEEAIVPMANYQLIVTYTDFENGIRASLVGVSTQALGELDASPSTTNFQASANANTSLRFFTPDDGEGAIQGVSLKRTS